MAKSARSKTRKHWASERRRTLGVPGKSACVCVVGRECTGTFDGHPDIHMYIHTLTLPHTPTHVHLKITVETKQLQEQARILKDSLAKQTSQPSIMKLKGMFARPTFRQQVAKRKEEEKRQESAVRRASSAASRTHTRGAGMDVATTSSSSASAPAAEEEGEEEEEEEEEEMEVESRRRKTGKERTVSRFKKSGVAYAAKKQKKSKPS